MKLCRRCNQPIAVTNVDDNTQRWQEQTADHHSTKDQCIVALSKTVARLDERLTGLEDARHVGMMDKRI